MTEVTGVTEVVGVKVEVDTKTVVLEMAEDAPGGDVVWVLVDVSIIVETD